MKLSTRKNLDPRVWLRGGVWKAAGWLDWRANQLARQAERLSEWSDRFYLGWNFFHYGAGAKPTKKELKRLREAVQNNEFPRICLVPKNHPSRMDTTGRSTPEGDPKA